MEKHKEEMDNLLLDEDNTESYPPGIYEVGKTLPAGTYAAFQIDGQTAYVSSYKLENGNREVDVKNESAHGERSFFLSFEAGHFVKTRQCLLVPIERVKEQGLLNCGIFFVEEGSPDQEYRVEVLNRGKKGFFCVYDGLDEKKLVAHKEVYRKVYVTLRAGQYFVAQDVSLCDPDYVDEEKEQTITGRISENEYAANQYIVGKDIPSGKYVMCAPYNYLSFVQVTKTSYPEDTGMLYSDCCCGLLQLEKGTYANVGEDTTLMPYEKVMEEPASDTGIYLVGDTLRPGTHHLTCSSKEYKGTAIVYDGNRFGVAKTEECSFENEFELYVEAGDILIVQNADLRMVSESDCPKINKTSDVEEKVLEMKKASSEAAKQTVVTPAKQKEDSKPVGPQTTTARWQMFENHPIITTIVAFSLMAMLFYIGIEGSIQYHYISGMEAFEDERYYDAMQNFEKSGSYKDAQTMIKVCDYASDMDYDISYMETDGLALRYDSSELRTLINTTKKYNQLSDIRASLIKAAYRSLDGKITMYNYPEAQALLRCISDEVQVSQSITDQIDTAIAQEKQVEADQLAAEQAQKEAEAKAEEERKSAEAKAEEARKAAEAKRAEELKKAAEEAKNGTTTSSSSSSSSKSSSGSSSSNSSSSTSKSSASSKNYYEDPYDEGYDDVYYDGDYDTDRYYSDWEYSLGVDDAMDELGEDW